MWPGSSAAAPGWWRRSERVRRCHSGWWSSCSGAVCLPGAQLGQRWLPWERLLVLLTKVDTFVEAHAPELRCSPHQLAHRLDPVRQAVQALGLPLYWLKQSMPPGAEVAVGLSSAWGFDRRSGRPYRREASELLRQYPGSAAARDAVVRDWAPFGLRAALIYAATGVVQGGIRAIEPRHLTALAG